MLIGPPTYAQGDVLLYAINATTIVHIQVHRPSRSVTVLGHLFLGRNTIRSGSRLAEFSGHDLLGCSSTGASETSNFFFLPNQNGCPKSAGLANLVMLRVLQVALAQSSLFHFISCLVTVTSIIDVDTTGTLDQSTARFKSG